MLHRAWLGWPPALNLAFPAHPGILVLDHAAEETLARVVDTFLAATPDTSLPNSLYWWRASSSWRVLAAHGWAALPADPI